MERSSSVHGITDKICSDQTTAKLGIAAKFILDQLDKRHRSLTVSGKDERTAAAEVLEVILECVLNVAGSLFERFRVGYEHVVIHIDPSCHLTVLWSKKRSHEAHTRLPRLQKKPG